MGFHPRNSMCPFRISNRNCWGYIEIKHKRFHYRIYCFNVLAEKQRYVGWCNHQNYTSELARDWYEMCCIVVIVPKPNEPFNQPLWFSVSVFIFCCTFLFSISFVHSVLTWLLLVKYLIQFLLYMTSVQFKKLDRREI